MTPRLIRHALPGMGKALAPLLAGLMTFATHAAKTDDAIVIGQTLPLTGPLFDSAQAVQGGATAWVEQVNASGGIGGRQVRLVTMDDRGEPALAQDNVKRMITEQGAVAVLNCLGDQLCQAAASSAEQLHVPLIGPISGAASLRAADKRYVVNIRPAYDRESAVLASQLRTMAVTSVALIGEAKAPQEGLETLTAALKKASIQTKLLLLPDSSAKSIEKMLIELGAGRYGAAVVSLSQDAVNRIDEGKFGRRPEWPLVGVSFASASITQLAQTLGVQIFGFTSVVPNPEQMSLPLVRSFQNDVDRYASPVASSFEGLEGYVNARGCLDALRNAQRPLTGDTVLAAARGLGSLNLGGFELRFERGRPNASERVEIGVKTRQQSFVR